MLILQGIARLVQFDDAGFLFFNATRRGFWRSFLAALFCLPVWGVSEALHQSLVETAQSPHFLAIQALSFILSWLAYPLVMIKVADQLGAFPNYYRYMVAYNWFQPVLQLAWIPLLLLDPRSGSIDPAMVEVFFLFALGVGLAYGWFIARRGLGIGPFAAAAVTLLDFLLGYFIDQMAVL